MTARLLLIAITAAATAVAAQAAPTASISHHPSNQTEDHHTTERARKLTTIDRIGWNDHVTRTLGGVLSRTAAGGVDKPPATHSAHSFLACNATSNDSTRQAATAGGAGGENATAGGDCGVSPHPPLDGISSNKFHSTAREHLRSKNISHKAAPKNRTICKPDDSREVCLIVRNQTGAAPEINVSLQKNDTDRERVDRIHNVTLLDRSTTREVQGGSDPRLARLRETQDTDDRLRRSTNTSGTERRVGVTVSIGNHPDIVIGASHATRDTNIKQNRETQQDKTNNTELYKNDGSRNESESQRRLRKSRGSVSLQETSKTFNYTFDKRNNPREAGGPPLGTTDHPLLVTSGQQLKQTATSRSGSNSRPPEHPIVSRPARPSNSSLHTDFNKTSLQRKDTLPFSDSGQPRKGTEPSEEAGIDSSLRPQHHGTLLVKSSDDEPLQQVGIPSSIIRKGGDKRPATHAGISSELGSGSSFPHQHNTAGEPAGSGHGAEAHGLTHWSKSHSRSGSKS
ncbi:uncharacterized protein LOC122377032 isoform X2 [Amphibalanus amphitrite]|uniref:uncharacterized protein LOC122377032 isoform X2 n=1 Tax=Amphibalanus amphitrite TaxID=1232801 RepID=UPI001C9030E0|nr:uncharacterized protein LOC122377032 isoform X2 [Amphibalanus amphitrite]